MHRTTSFISNDKVILRDKHLLVRERVRYISSKTLCCKSNRRYISKCIKESKRK